MLACSIQAVKWSGSIFSQYGTVASQPATKLIIDDSNLKVGLLISLNSNLIFPCDLHCALVLQFSIK